MVGEKIKGKEKELGKHYDLGMRERMNSGQNE